MTLSLVQPILLKTFTNSPCVQFPHHPHHVSAAHELSPAASGYSKMYPSHSLRSRTLPIRTAKRHQPSSFAAFHSWYVRQHQNLRIRSSPWLSSASKMQIRQTYHSLQQIAKPNLDRRSDENKRRRKRTSRTQLPRYWSSKTLSQPLPTGPVPPWLKNTSRSSTGSMCSVSQRTSVLNATLTRRVNHAQPPTSTRRTTPGPLASMLRKQWHIFR